MYFLSLNVLYNLGYENDDDDGDDDGDDDDDGNDDDDDSNDDIEGDCQQHIIDFLSLNVFYNRNTTIMQM